jgi:hypothetical protein
MTLGVRPEETAKMAAVVKTILRIGLLSSFECYIAAVKMQTVDDRCAQWTGLLLKSVAD